MSSHSGCDVCCRLEAILEFLDEQQGKEGAGNTWAANRHVAAVVRLGEWQARPWPGREQRSTRSRVADIAQHDLKSGGELGVGAQHIEPVKSARPFGDPRLVDGRKCSAEETVFLEIAAETAVADEAPCRPWGEAWRAATSRMGPLRLLGQNRAPAPRRDCDRRCTVGLPDF